MPKAKLEVLCADGDVDALTDVLVATARTGAIGDGKVWVTDVARVIRVRTGELDADAV